MKQERAKEILSAHRAGLGDVTDPDVVEALRALESNPELAAWVEADQRFDTQFRTAIANVKVPARRIEASPRSSRRRVWIYAAAAALLILIGGLGIAGFRSRYNQRIHARADFREAMAYYSAGGYFWLDRTSSELDELQAFMRVRNGLTGDDLAEAFAYARPMGCKVIAWRDHQVSLYCFLNDDRKIVHAYVIRLDELGDSAVTRLAERKQVYGLETGGWVSGETAYLLVGSEADVSIEPFLVTSGWESPHDRIKHVAVLSGATRSPFGSPFVKRRMVRVIPYPQTL